MPKIEYDGLWHGSRPTYYFRKAKHAVSQPFYSLMRWKYYGYDDEDRNDPAWEARLEAIKSPQSQSITSVHRLENSYFPCVDQVLSEAASQRSSSSFSKTSDSSTMIAELEDTQVRKDIQAHLE